MAELRNKETMMVEKANIYIAYNVRSSFFPASRLIIVVSPLAYKK